MVKLLLPLGSSHPSCLHIYLLFKLNLETFSLLAIVTTTVLIQVSIVFPKITIGT